LTSTTSESIRTVPFARPWITDQDRQAVAAVLDGHILTHGPEGKAFEDEFATFLGAGAHCVSVSSCMAALHLSFLQFGIAPGDEVIVPAQTHAATAHAAEWVGATVIFADCDPATGNVTVETIRPLITKRTKAIAVVHFVGIPCAMPEIAQLAAQHDLRLIEDCALSVGARYDGVHTGLFGDAGCFSFYPVKHLTTAEGGMFVSRHAEVAEQVGRLRAFGVDRTHSERSVPGMYDVPSLGLNYRMSELQAALGRSQLRRVDDNLARRRANFGTLAEAIREVPDVRILDGTGNSHYCLTLVLERALRERRGELVARLNAAGVGTSLYYPQPVPRMTYYSAKYGYEPARYANAAEISDFSVALPVGPHLEPDDVQYVADVAVSSLRNLSA
jgi:perosamine synthetase